MVDNFIRFAEPVKLKSDKRVVLYEQLGPRRKP